MRIKINKLLNPKKNLAFFIISLLVTILIALFVYPPKFSSKTILNIAKTSTPYQTNTKEISNFLSSSIFKSTDDGIQNYEVVIKPKNDNEIFIIVTGNTILDTKIARDREIVKILTYLDKIRQSYEADLLDKIQINRDHLNSVKRYKEDLLKAKFNTLDYYNSLASYEEKIQTLSTDLINLESIKNNFIINKIFISDSSSTSISFQSAISYLLIFSLLFLALYYINEMMLLISKFFLKKHS